MANPRIPKAFRSIAMKAKRRLPGFRHVVVVLGSMVVGALLIILCTYTVGRLAAPAFRSTAVILDVRKPGLRENETDLHSVLTSPKVMKRIASNSKIASLFGNRTSDEVQNELFSNLSFHATPVSNGKRFSIGDTIGVSFDSLDREFARTVLELPAFSIRGIKWSIVIGALAGFGVGLLLNRRNSVPASNSNGKSK